jgi:hypothetical protein
MALKTPSTPLIIALTQGSADAFIQGSVITGLQAKQAYRLDGIAFSLSEASMAALSATGTWDYRVTLTRRSKAALPEITDTDVIASYSLANGFTTSGAYMFTGDYYWKPDVEIPLVEEIIYAQLDSTAIGAAITVNLRMDVTLDSISDIDKLNLIARSLQ